MSLKIHFLNQTKKVVLKDELRSQGGFFELMERVAQRGRQDFQVFFTDREHDKVLIADQIDLDYFLNDCASTNQFAVRIEFMDKEAEEPLEPAKPLAEAPKGDATECFGFENIRSSVEMPLALPLLRRTSDMNCQTERVDTTERFAETIAFQVENNGQQTTLNLECKDTQTKKADAEVEADATGLDPLTQSLLERIEVLEKSFSQSMCQFKSQAEPKSEALPRVTPVPAPAPAKPAENQGKIQVTTNHVGITCDGCKKYNFVGKRYKCLVCDDYDLCEACEGTNEHQHPMIRMTSQGNNFLLQKMWRKYNKFTQKFQSGGAGPFGRMGHGLGQALQDLIGTPGNSGRCGRFGGPRGCGFRNQRGFAGPNGTEQAKESKQVSDKREMLKFMLPDHPEHWEGILSQYSGLSLEEFCAVMAAWEPPMTN